MAKKVKSVKTEKKLIAETVVEKETETVRKLGQTQTVEVPKGKKPEPKSKEPAVYGA